ncbi:unnamed protein product [Symbiodinium sp. CCMP2592]|nr:unnamed protein product [Symbiodinium sp. CCMP2592]
MRSPTPNYMKDTVAAKGRRSTSPQQGPLSPVKKVRRTTPPSALTSGPSDSPCNGKASQERTLVRTIDVYSDGHVVVKDVSQPEPSSSILLETERQAFVAWSLDAFSIINSFCRNPSSQIDGTYNRHTVTWVHSSIQEGEPLVECAEILHNFLSSGYRKLAASNKLETHLLTLWRTSDVALCGGQQWLSFSTSNPLKYKTKMMVLPKAMRHRARGVPLDNDGVCLSRWPAEAEILFPPGTVFGISEQYKRSDGVYVLANSALPALKRLQNPTWADMIRQAAPPGWQQDEALNWVEELIVLKE